MTQSVVAWTGTAQRSLLNPEESRENTLFCLLFSTFSTVTWHKIFRRDVTPMWLASEEQFFSLILLAGGEVLLFRNHFRWLFMKRVHLRRSGLGSEVVHGCVMEWSKACLFGFQRARSLARAPSEAQLQGKFPGCSVLTEKKSGWRRVTENLSSGCVRARARLCRREGNPWLPRFSSPCERARWREIKSPIAREAVTLFSERGDYAQTDCCVSRRCDASDRIHGTPEQRGGRGVAPSQGARAEPVAGCLPHRVRPRPVLGGNGPGRRGVRGAVSAGLQTEPRRGRRSHEGVRGPAVTCVQGKLSLQFSDNLLLLWTLMNTF